MLLKKFVALTVAGAALGAAVPALADPPYWASGHGHRAKHYAPRGYVIYRRPVIVRPAPLAVYGAPVYYAPAPAPVYYGPPPMPAYRVYGTPAAGGALAGAVAGALIGGSVSHGDQRVAGIAIGSVLGAVVGHELAGRPY